MEIDTGVAVSIISDTTHTGLSHLKLTLKPSYKLTLERAYTVRRACSQCHLSRHQLYVTSFGGKAGWPKPHRQELVNTDSVRLEIHFHN